MLVYIDVGATGNYHLKRSAACIFVAYYMSFPAKAAGTAQTRQTFIQALLSIAIFSQRLSLFTV